MKYNNEFIKEDNLTFEYSFGQIFSILNKNRFIVSDHCMIEDFYFFNNNIFN